MPKSKCKFSVLPNHLREPAECMVYIEVVLRRYCSSSRHPFTCHRFENLYQLIHVICTNSFRTTYKSAPFYSCLFKCTSVLCTRMQFRNTKSYSNCFPLATWHGSCSCRAHIILVIDLQCWNGHRPMATLSNRVLVHSCDHDPSTIYAKSFRQHGFSVQTNTISLENSNGYFATIKYHLRTEMFPYNYI